MSNSVMWKELTAEELRAKAAANAIVVLPVASMEQHASAGWRRYHSVRGQAWRRNSCEDAFAVSGSFEGGKGALCHE